MQFRILSFLVSGWLGLLAAAPAVAVPVTVPTGLSPGDQYRLAFVTSTTRDAISSAIGDYNAFVASVANGVPELVALGTTWTAIASTATTDARDNTQTNPNTGIGVPIYHLGDALIASDNADLWDQVIDAPLDCDEQGNCGGGGFVWTGTSSLTGELFPGAGLGDAEPLAGHFGFQVGWVDSLFSPAATAYHVYAISSVLTVVPEPGTAGLLGMCLLLMGSGRHIRR